MVPSLFDPYYMAVTRRINEIVAARGYTAFTLSSDGSLDQEQEAIRTFTSMNVAGSIIAPLGRRAIYRCTSTCQASTTMPTLAALPTLMP